MNFPTAYDKIVDRINLIDPVNYTRTRNYLHGAFTGLSPYISRGLLSTRQVFEDLSKKATDWFQIEKLVQELAWRDYWQQVWIARRSAINADLRQTQPTGFKKGLPTAVIKHQTGIVAIDQGITELYSSGYMHNHIRMYVASVVCNIAECHWRTPAHWMYYHLLDADWASNALSWQWVCGANSQKLYYANQENINKYCLTDQRNTFLDIHYDQFGRQEMPGCLIDVAEPELQLSLPSTTVPLVDPNLPTMVYNFYNLDPAWRSGMLCNRILLLEPSVFESYPVSKKSIDFAIALAEANIAGISVWVAEFTDLQKLVSGQVFYKEHPLNNYAGCEDAREWLSEVTGDFPSFFAFWKKCKKELM